MWAFHTVLSLNRFSPPWSVPPPLRGLIAGGGGWVGSLLPHHEKMGLPAPTVLESIFFFCRDSHPVEQMKRHLFNLTRNLIQCKAASYGEESGLL